jgi:hypothetical protein
MRRRLRPAIGRHSPHLRQETLMSTGPLDRFVQDLDTCWTETAVAEAALLPRVEADRKSVV